MTSLALCDGCGNTAATPIGDPLEWWAIASSGADPVTYHACSRRCLTTVAVAIEEEGSP